MRCFFFSRKEDVFRAIFYGLGSDGTVGANKESIKIIGENTDNYAQAYFVYDSKKAGAMTISPLRFGPRPVRSTYLISSANFVGCHQPGFLERYGVLDPLLPQGTFLLNAFHRPVRRILTNSHCRRLQGSLQRTNPARASLWILPQTRLHNWKWCRP